MEYFRIIFEKISLIWYLKNMFRMSDKMKCFRSNMIRKKMYEYISKGIEG